LRDEERSMSGITSSTGLFSGINSQQLIEQLLALEARPKTSAQQRVAQFQLQQTSYLDLNSRLSSLKATAKIFKDSKIFQSMAATSANDKVLTATASAGAAPGTYSFLVDRLVSAQQMLSKGFASKDAAQGATSITVESAQARLDKDLSLSDLNGGAGITRGKLSVTDSQGKIATIDLTKAATVDDVLNAINNNGTASVTASVVDGKFVVKDNAGGNIQVANSPGSTTASSLGIAGSGAGTITGSTVYYLSRDTALSSLNDGNGVYIKSATGTGGSQFSIKVNGTSVAVNLGDVYTSTDTNNDNVLELNKVKGAVTTVGGVLDRINEALTGAGFTTVKASISDSNSLAISDSNGTATMEIVDGADGTAASLGLKGSATADLGGTRVLAGLKTVMAGSLNGGKGLAGDGVLSFKLKDGSTFAVTVGNSDSLDQIAQIIQNASGAVSGSPKLKVSINSKGTGLSLVDSTTGSDNLTITGTNGSDTAASLGISTGSSGTTEGKVDSGNLQRQYISKATLVSQLNGGKGIGTGTFRISDSFGTVGVVDIGDDTKTVGELIDEINSRGLKIRASLNAKGDGIQIAEDVGTGSAGTTKIKIEDATGSVAKNLSINKEATGVGASNVIDGSAEKTITLAATDSISDIASKINSAVAGISATVINDGAGSTPFRLSLSSNSTGRAGRVIIDSGTLDLGLRTLDTGEDSRVFFGSTDVSKAVLLTSSSNTLDNVVSNVKIDLKGVDSNPVSLTVASDSSKIEASINDFLKSFNTIVDRIDAGSTYNGETNRRGPLFGDTTSQGIRDTLYRTLQAEAKGLNGRYRRLLDIGVEVGSGGTLKLNTDRLRKALSEDPAAVEALFTTKTESKTSSAEKREYTSLGAMGSFEVLADLYTDSVSGTLTKRNQSLDDLIKSQNSRITDIDARIERKRATLQGQFLAMEKAIAQLQTQQSSISQIGRR
jgi:flagellar hook-associated protein 2